VIRIPSFVEVLEVARSHGRHSENPQAWRGVVGDWPFAQGQGPTLFDVSGYGRDGTLVSDPLWEVSEKGSVLHFDGSDDHVTMGDVLDFRGDEPFSALCWVKHDSTPSAFQVYLGKQDSDATKRGWLLRNGPPGDREDLGFILAYDVSASNSIFVLSTATVLTSAWQQIGFSYDGSGATSGITLYVDGKPVATSDDNDNLTNDATTHSASFGLGARLEDDAGNVDGLMQLARVYDCELTADDFAQDYADPWERYRRRQMVYSAVTAAPTGNRRRRMLLGNVA